MLFAEHSREIVRRAENRKPVVDPVSGRFRYSEIAIAHANGNDGGAIVPETA